MDEAIVWDNFGRVNCLLHAKQSSYTVTHIIVLFFLFANSKPIRIFGFRFFGFRHTLPYRFKVCFSFVRYSVVRSFLLFSSMVRWTMLDIYVQAKRVKLVRYRSWFWCSMRIHTFKMCKPYPPANFFLGNKYQQYHFHCVIFCKI